MPGNVVGSLVAVCLLARAPVHAALPLLGAMDDWFDKRVVVSQ